MTFKHFAAIAAVAFGTFYGVTPTFAEGAQNIGRIVLEVAPKGFIPKPLPNESNRPTALVVRAGEYVFCTDTTDYAIFAGNGVVVAGAFVEETSRERKLCFPMEKYNLKSIGLDSLDF